MVRYGYFYSLKDISLMCRFGGLCGTYPLSSERGCHGGGRKFFEQDDAPEVCDLRGIVESYRAFVKIVVGGVVNLLNLPNAILCDRIKH
ncbi:MAG: hypothetical protein QOD67_2805 [Caballeronia sp.]|nr:hypothetical protein [Caballeronia sp.]MEA3125786.1 hypothetical protein [Caballeronia sp.]